MHPSVLKAKNVIKGIFPASMYQQLRENILLRHYVKKFRLKHARYRNIVYFVIDPHRTHPGLADRIKAIINTYNWAKKNGLEFKLIFNTPFNLEEFLLPNMPWNGVTLNDLEYSIFDTRFISEDKLAKEGNAYCDTQEHRISIKKKQLHCYHYSGNILPERFDDTGYLWKDLFNELFSFNNSIQQSYNGLNIAKPYIAVHARFVNALENFENSDYGSYLQSDEEKSKLIQKCKNALCEIASENPEYDVYMFSDSKVFLENISELSVRTLDTKNIGHISESSTSTYNKTFLDLYAISRASKVYMLSTTELYRSSCFAKLGARIGGIPFYIKEF